MARESKMNNKVTKARMEFVAEFFIPQAAQLQGSFHEASGLCNIWKNFMTMRSAEYEKRLLREARQPPIRSLG